MEDKARAGKKKKVRYNVLLVPDTASETVRQLSINLQVIKIAVAAAAVLFIAALLYCAALKKQLDESHTNEMALQIQIDGLVKQKELLISQKVEQSKKISSLSETLSDKERREAEMAKAYVPLGFPVKGTASYDGTKTELDGNPIAMFHVSAGTGVTATASGTVSKVAGGESGYAVTVDHGNGYFTIYRNGTRPKVQKGTAVTKETEIFTIEAGKEDLGYQIMENDKYIDPLSLMEAYG